MSCFSSFDISVDVGCTWLPEVLGESSLSPVVFCVSVWSSERTSSVHVFTVKVLFCNESPTSWFWSSGQGEGAFGTGGGFLPGGFCGAGLTGTISILSSLGAGDGLAALAEAEARGLLLGTSPVLFLSRGRSGRVSSELSKSLRKDEWYVTE